MVQNIFWLEDIKQEHRPMVGGKGANLGDLYRGLQVPKGFCLSAKAYGRQSLEAGWGPRIESYLNRVDLRDFQTIEEASEQIRNVILQTPFLSEIEQSIVDAYEQLCAEAHKYSGVELRVAVRSSATAEDLKEASFAGQQDTFLNIAGLSATLQGVKECWASLWNTRALHYRFTRGFDHRLVRMAVIVQEMIPAQIAGVMFTANPVSNSREEIFIEAVRGLGEALVSGERAGDTYILNKAGLELVERNIADADQGQMLPDFKIRELALAGSKIEGFYSDYQDVEWAYYQGQLYFLQARPMTTLRAEELKDIEWDRLNSIQQEFLVTIQERFPEPIYPIDGEVVKAYFSAQFTAMENEGYHVPEVDWKKVQQGIFPEFFLPPAIKLGLFTKLSLLFRLSSTIKIDSQREWAKHQKDFGEIIEKLAKRDFTTYPFEVIFRYLNDVFNQFEQFVEGRYRLYTLERLPRKVFQWMMVKMFAERSQEVSEGLIAGVPSITLEINDALEGLASSVSQWPLVHNLIVSYEPVEAWKQINEHERRKEPEFRHSPEVLDQYKAFLAHYEKFLKQYGDRETTMGLGGLASPTWREAPEVVLGILRSLLVDKETDSCKRRQILVERKRVAEEMLSQKLTQGLWRWLPVRWLIRQLVEYQQSFAAFRENSHYDLTSALNAFRILFLMLGERMVRMQILARAEDILYLPYEEIKRAFFDIYLHQSLDPIGYKNLVEINKAKQVQRLDAWLTRKNRQGQTEEQVLQGHAVSGGVVTGIARVITNPGDFGRLQPGEILVAPYTNPAWTPLFATAGGMVVDVGGVASHAAIIAREYAIPAVMGIPGASRLIEDGQTITVNGSTGIVLRR